MGTFEKLLNAAKAGGKRYLKDARIAATIQNLIEEDSREAVKIYRGWEGDKRTVELFVDINNRIDLNDSELVRNGWLSVEGQIVAICHHAHEWKEESQYFELGMAWLEDELVTDLRHAAEVMGFEYEEIEEIVSGYLVRASEVLEHEFTRDDLRVRVNGDVLLFSFCYQQLPGGGLFVDKGKVILVYTEGC